ncbi:MAG TPA: glycosyltransferase [Planctomycetota bacterium]|nr:glycosyltransferase [Planctomycetota bacterium]
MEDGTPRGLAAGVQPGRLTVFVATCDRSFLLGGLLESMASEWDDLDEVVIVVNGTRDGSVELAERFTRRWPGLRVLRRAEPGKTRALNHGLAKTSGSLLAFLDDDVTIQPGWAAALRAGFARHGGDVALQGRIRMPRPVREDPLLMARVTLRRTHVLVDPRSDEFHRPRSLTGANFAMRRSTLERLGGFNEALGPGASGLCDDTDLGWRLLEAGGRIEFVPGAVVEHHFHRERLDEDYFVDYFTRQGRSRWVLKGRPPTMRVLPEYLLCRAREGLVSLWGDENLRTHVRARALHYKAMLDSARCGEPVPLRPVPRPQAARP